MQTIRLKKGLDLPITGKPEQTIRSGNQVRQVALVGDDYAGMKPTMLVSEGDQVRCGQALFKDKKNDGVLFTAPGCGTVKAINRGARRKFESLIIDLQGDDPVQFCEPTDSVDSLGPEPLRQLLSDAGLWPAFRTRPYGKTPPIDSLPAALFITVMDSSPLAAEPRVVIERAKQKFRLGLAALRKLVDCPIHYCTAASELLPHERLEGIDYCQFTGPHPAGLASTHIHFLSPVHEGKTVWQIGYQDVIAIGGLLQTGRLYTERVVALAGPGVIRPSLVTTRLGANLADICRKEITLDEVRVISGSVLSGRQASEVCGFLGRYHDQVSVIPDSSGRSIFNWLLPGSNRFSSRPVFASTLIRGKEFAFNTATWGGHRAIYPLGTYDEVMPLDIIATSLLKAVVKGDTEKAKALGALELIEEDVALCGFVCPGKNDFGQALRELLNAIEMGG